MVSQAFPKQCRLLDSPQFQYVFDDAPVRASHRQLLLLARPNQLAHARLGLVVGKKNVRRAVDRNRVKRIVRESFRLRQHDLPPLDIIALARRGAGQLTHDELGTITVRLWEQLIRRALAYHSN